MWLFIMGAGIPVVIYCIVSVAATIHPRLGIIVAIVMGIFVLLAIITLVKFNQALDNIFSLGGLLSF